MISGLINGEQALSAVNTRIAEILANPGASHWLKQAVTDLMRRDPLDAASDADALAEVMMARACLMVGDTDPDDVPGGHTR